MKTYEQKKEEIRQQAIEWQQQEESQAYSMSDYAYYTEYFKKVGKRYGLIGEFFENGII